jgi:hypothetical protein
VYDNSCVFSLGICYGPDFALDITIDLVVVSNLTVTINLVISISLLVSISLVIGIDLVVGVDQVVVFNDLTLNLVVVVVALTLVLNCYTRMS